MRDGYAELLNVSSKVLNLYDAYKTKILRSYMSTKTKVDLPLGENEDRDDDESNLKTKENGKTCYSKILDVIQVQKKGVDDSSDGGSSTLLWRRVHFWD